MKISVKNFGIFLLIVTAAVCTYFLKPTRYFADAYPRATLASEIPIQIGHWKRLEINVAPVVDPTRQKVINYLYSETLSASYVNDQKQLIMLSLAYGKDQSDGREVHKPELCYPAQGFTILDQRDEMVDIDSHHRIRVKYMKTQNGERIEPLIYWTTAGDYLYQSKIQKKLIALKHYSPIKLIPDGMVLRVSTIEPDGILALDNMSNFVKNWHASMPAAQKKRYFGSEKS